MTVHAVIPDCQVKPGYSTEYLGYIGQYIADKKPDTIVCLGDFADMPSLSSYDRGRKSFEGRRYRSDLEAVWKGMDNLLKPIQKEVGASRRNKNPWKPNKIMLLGNHENRINKVVEEDARLEGTISHNDLGYEAAGWEVVSFLQPKIIDGVVYCHYLVSGVMGRPITSASRLLSTRHMSCVVGHQQGRQIATAVRADGSLITAIIAGSAYEHDEDYLGPQGNNHWRGIIFLHEVNNGSFDEMFVSLNYLRKRYGS